MLATVEVRGEAALAAAELARSRAIVQVWRPDLPAQSTPELPLLPPAPERLTAGHARFAAHPRAAALQAQLTSARSDESLAARFLLLPQLEAGWQHQEISGVTFDGPILGLSWPIPLADRDRAERLAAARRRAERDWQ